MSEECQRCGRMGDDRRRLWMACRFEMEELGLPFLTLKLEDRMFYTLRVCKKCRAEWMAAIASWFKNPPVEMGPGSGIFIREDTGETREITRQEWDRRFPNQEPNIYG